VTGQYCVDANIFITAWNIAYPIHVFPSLWEQMAQYQNDFILIKPIFDEIDPISSADRKMPKDKKKKKYPLRVWMEDHQFIGTPITDDVKAMSLNLEKEYETNNNPRGANQNDITLIAYAKLEEKVIVTLEAEQPQKTGKKCNYKIPLICDDQGVACMSFVRMLGRLGIRI